MSRPLRICLVGASGLVGSKVIEACVGRADVRLVAVARRELHLPPGARMEVLLTDPEHWGDAIAGARPDTVVSALGTTWASAGKDEQAFRAVDEKLVLDCARWGLEAGARQFVAVSSAGADPGAKPLYLRVKGETELALGRIGYPRLDVLRPGLLIGRRSESRPLERLAQLAAPVTDLLMRGRWAQWRSFRADQLAEVVLALAHERARGRFVHDRASMLRALKRQAYQASIAGTLAATVD